MSTSRVPGRATPNTTLQLPQPVTNVSSYGAVGDGHTDSGSAIRQALAVAEQLGGTLYFPAGHYLLSAPNTGGAMSVKPGLALTLAGAGANSTTLTGLTISAPLLAIRGDHITVQDLTLDDQSTNLGYPLYLVANYATIQRCHLLGGSHFFDIFAAGDAGGNSGNTGNRLLNDLINDRTQYPLGAGISWSYQNNSLFDNIVHTGSRLGLFKDNNVTVDNYTYYPGPNTNVDQGFWISSPSNDITINNFTTYGDGGRLSTNGGVADTNITINNERFMGSGGELRINGAAGLTISGCNFGSSNTLAFATEIPISAAKVENCTSLPRVTFYDSAPLSATFSSDNLPATTPSVHTFTDLGSSGLASFTVTGGTWENQAGGFAAGGHMTYTVDGLGGYS